jgi:hypothetical protein
VVLSSGLQIFCSFLKTSNKVADFISLFFVILDLKYPFHILLFVSFCIHHLKAVCNGGCLKQILKHEWPARWRSFIPDLVSGAKTSEACKLKVQVVLSSGTMAV